MKPEPSKLAQLVIGYYERFRRHVPEQALQFLDAGKLAPMLQDALATGEPLSETGWDRAISMEFSPRGCIVREENPRKRPDGEWLQ